MVIDHIGIIVKNIKSSRKKYEDLLGYEIISEIILDSFQKVKVQFLRNSNGQKIELIEPLGVDSPSFNALKKGAGVNHICYQCENLEYTLKILRASHCIVVCKPIIGAGHEGRKIAFVVHPEMGLIEFVENKKKDL